MSEERETPHKAEAPLGIYARRPAREGPGTAEMLAAAMSVLWLLGAGVFFLLLGGDGKDSAGGGEGPLRIVMVVLAVALPLALIWVAAAAARSARIMREESERLHGAITGMRQSYLQMQQAIATGTSRSVEQRLEEIAAAQRKTEDAIATFTSSRPPAPVTPPPPAPAAPQGDEQQGLLALGPAEAADEPLATDDLIRALNFPETAEDREGFRALRAALRNRQAAGLVQASQDVLTLLSQDGIYMDDLAPDRARPEVWRRFAAGERGGAIKPLGGVHDRSSLALAAGRMRSDSIFRDAAHHFLRKFDHTFADLAPNLTDREIAALAETRTARAFMLLGRVTGTFD